MQKGSKIKDLARAAVFAAVAFFAFASAQAEWLYWKVDFTSNDAKDLVPAWSGSESPYVWLVAVNNTTGEKTTLSGFDQNKNAITYVQLDVPEDEDGSSMYELMAMDIASSLLGSLDDETQYSFLVEMGNITTDSSGKIVEEALYTTITPQTHKDLQINGYIRSGDQFSDKGSWNPALIGFKAVPEPTGGMLFGFGLCLLALRRRRKRGAA
jgi:hypothetical protein